MPSFLRSWKGDAADLLVIGDATLDVFLQIHEASVTCALNKLNCSLCLDYAEKIPVESVIKVPGAGNASNAAIATSRLGMRTALYSVIGNDQAGQDMIKQWRQEQINVRHIVQDKKQESNYSTVLSFRGERTILVYHYPRTYRLPPQVNAEWMYYTSCGPGHEKMEPDLIHYLDAHAKTRLVFNPGTHQLKRGLKNLAPLLERCTILSLNREEAERLLESTSLPLPKMMRAFHRYGVEICLITDGEKGSYASDGELMWKCPIFPGPCLERTGAGDGYTSAFLAAIFRGQDIPEAMRYGTAEAWSVVQYTGPQKGLLSLPRLHSIIKRFRAVRITSSRL